MKEPILVVMAAGMGSRYGGLKQMDPLGPDGEIIIDFSLFDAKRAGFQKVVFIIKKAIAEDFQKVMEGRGVGLDISYVYQEVDDLPAGFTVPEGRIKPWGTGHAILACRHMVDAPFAVINADDYYGPQAFQLLYDQLKTACDHDYYEYAMVGYELENTVTDHGHVARGVCTVSDASELENVVERTRIEKHDGGIAFTEDGETWTELPGKTLVSMNFWGFTPSILKELEAGFVPFLETMTNPEKAEYFLPSVVDGLIKVGKAKAKVLSTGDKWYGVTYQADRDSVKAALAQCKVDGLYPKDLWNQ